MLTDSRMVEHAGHGFTRIAIFSAPLPFHGAAEQRQRVALASWLRLHPAPRIVLLGRHPSLKTVARIYGDQVDANEDVDCSFLGPPLFHSMFSCARGAEADIAVLVSPDVVLLDDFSIALEKVRQVQGDWILVSYGWTVMSDFPFDYDESSRSWQSTLNGSYVDDEQVAAYVRRTSEVQKCEGPAVVAWNTARVPLHAGVMPPFMSGHSRFCTQWLVNEAIESKLRRVIDMSQAVTAIHLPPGQKVQKNEAIDDSLHAAVGAFANVGPNGISWQDTVDRYLALSYGSFSIRRHNLASAAFALVKCKRQGAGGLCFLKRGTKDCDCKAGVGSFPGANQTEGKTPTGQGGPITAITSHLLEETGAKAGKKMAVTLNLNSWRQLNIATVLPLEVQSRILDEQTAKGNMGKAGSAVEVTIGTVEPLRRKDVEENRTTSAAQQKRPLSLENGGTVAALVSPITGSASPLVSGSTVGRNVIIPEISGGCHCTEEGEGRTASCEVPYLSEMKGLAKQVGLPQTIEQLLEVVASKDRVVILAAAAKNYIEMLMSWACGLQRLKVQNFLVSALDEETFRFATLQGLPVFRHSFSEEFGPDKCHFGTTCFQKLTKVKSRIVVQILRLGYHVLFNDVDVYWFHNPLPELLTYPSSTLVVQSDNWNDTGPDNDIRRINSGFYLARSDPFIIGAFDKIVEHAANSPRTEQPSFYDVLCGITGRHRVGTSQCLNSELNLTVQFLSRDRFPNGATRLLWDKDTRGECERIGCMVLHNNWVGGRHRKLSRQKEKGLWDYNVRSRMCMHSWQGPNTERVY